MEGAENCFNTLKSSFRNPNTERSALPRRRVWKGENGTGRGRQACESWGAGGARPQAANRAAPPASSVLYMQPCGYWGAVSLRKRETRKLGAFKVFKFKILVCAGD